MLSFDLKYRPQTLDDVWGNEVMVNELKNDLAKGVLPHLIVFLGQVGTGKTTISYVLDKALSCRQRDQYEPCGVCSRCKAIEKSLFQNGESIQSLGVFKFEMGSKTAPEYIQTTLELLSSNVNRRELLKIHLDELQIVNIRDQDRLNDKIEFVTGNKSNNKYVFITASNKNSIHPGILSRARVYYLERPDITEQVNRAYQICLKEQIPLSKTKLKQLVVVSESPRKLLKNLEDIKYGTADTFNRVVGSVNNNIKPYIDYMTAIKLGIHQITHFVENEISDPASFLRGFPNFLMGYIRKTYDREYIIDKAISDQLDVVLSCYSLKTITDVMKSIDSLHNITADFAVRKLFLIGYDFNISLYQLSQQTDATNAVNSVEVHDSSGDELEVKNNNGIQALATAVTTATATLSEDDL